MLDLAVELDVIKKSGAWFSYDGQKLGQGRDNAKKALEENPELMAVTKASKKRTKLEEAAETAALGDIDDIEDIGDMNEIDPVISAEDDFEEFTPADDE